MEKGGEVVSAEMGGGRWTDIGGTAEIFNAIPPAQGTIGFGGNNNNMARGFLK